MTSVAAEADRVDRRRSRGAARLASEPAPAAGGRADVLARYYDLDLQDDPGDLDLYLALAARTGGPVLELAVGSGRLAVPLARAGFTVTGVDHDPSMLERARAAWERGRGRRRRDALRLVEADLTGLRLGERFGLAILALNSLLLLADDERQAAALRTMAAHLRPGGLAVVDVFVPDAADLANYDGRLVLEWLREDPQTGEQVAKLVSARYDAATGSVALVQVFEASPADGGPVRRVVRGDRMHLVSGAQLTRLARDAGLEVEHLGGDHQVTPFGPGSERAVLIARAL